MGAFFKLSRLGAPYLLGNHEQKWPCCIWKVRMCKEPRLDSPYITSPGCSNSLRLNPFNYKLGLLGVILQEN